MKCYSLFDAPLRVSGVPFWSEKKTLERLPREVLERLPNLTRLGQRCPGGRVAFKTDSPVFRVRVTLKTLRLDAGMSLYSAQSAQVMVGQPQNARYLGVVNPPNYETLTFEREFRKSSQLEQVTIYFPRNEQLENIEVFVQHDATVTEPDPYRYEKPIVFYGSSITEGGCACNTINAYNAILSRWLDFDYYNLGFSGSCKAEPAMADYINTLDMGVFVYDYDHNAPTVEHLQATHKPFFDRIRQSHPNIPILMLTRPAEYYTEGMKARREVVKATYEAARAAGDENVYFIDGETYFGDADRNLCTIDGTHPNDLGFFRMATTIRPVMERILKTLK